MSDSWVCAKGASLLVPSGPGNKKHLFIIAIKPACCTGMAANLWRWQCRLQAKGKAYGMTMLARSRPETILSSCTPALHEYKILANDPSENITFKTIP